MMNTQTLFSLAMSCGALAIAGPVLCSIDELGPIKQYCGKATSIATPCAVLFACGSVFLAFAAQSGSGMM